MHQKTLVQVDRLNFHTRHTLSGRRPALVGPAAHIPGIALLPTFDHLDDVLHDYA